MKLKDMEKAIILYQKICNLDEKIKNIDNSSIKVVKCRNDGGLNIDVGKFCDDEFISGKIKNDIKKILLEKRQKVMNELKEYGIEV